MVIDAVGIQDIWASAADYLKDDGLFVTVGVALKDYTISNMLYISWLMMLKNVFWPIWLGGVPRKYVRVTGLVTPERLQKLGDLVEQGKLKVIVDSCWEMQDAQQVSFLYIAMMNGFVLTGLGV